MSDNTGLHNLFSPITINGMELKNRAVMPAMGTMFGNRDNTVSDRLKSYFAARARGGTGLIITGVCAIDPRGRGFGNQIGIWDETFIPGLKDLSDTIHKEGAKIAVQLHHAGRESMKIVLKTLPEAPSAIPSPNIQQPVEAMSIERIEEVVQFFAAGAARAREAGFDAVEIHGAHGYLVHQFLSPFSNQRTDKYGGSDENRARFALEIIRAVRAAVGPDFPLMIRISVSEEIRQGYGPDFTTWLAPQLVEAGVDLIHASVGALSTPGNLAIATMDMPPGFNLERARIIKNVVDVPVIGVGRVQDVMLAEEALERGDADLIAFGRQHLADPDFINKARQGAFEDIRPCIACNQGCIERMMYEIKPITCVFNPECGEEYHWDYKKTGSPKNIWVIGAGPGGLSAAFYAAGRGHRVTVFEAEDEPGGQLIPASSPPHKEDLRDWLGWILRQLDKAGVAVQCGTRVTEEMIAGERPDAVVLASGARHFVPDIPGIESDIVVSAREVLEGRAEAVLPVVILGAGYVGMETADFIIDNGRGVVIYEMSEQLPVGKHTAHGYWLHKRLRDAGGRIELGAKVLRIERDGIVYQQGENGEHMEPAATVINALGAVSNNELVRVIKNLDIPCKVIGDAAGPRRFIEAIHEGARAGIEI